jgi:hypothetical protein
VRNLTVKSFQSLSRSCPSRHGGSSDPQKGGVASSAGFDRRTLICPTLDHFQNNGTIFVKI